MPDHWAMEMLILVITLGLVTALVVGLSEKIGLPWPALMVVVGAGVALVPGIVPVIDPDLILPVFIPPLLYSAAQRSSWQVMRAKWRALLWLALGLVVVTVAAVAATAMALLPGITLAAAIALGAMVAPPDPVAVESVARSVPIPRRVLMTLQSEGLFNDAASLVIFQLALSAAVSGTSLDPGVAAVRFLVGAVVAVAIGWGSAWLLRLGTRSIDSTMARSSATLVLPFFAYLVAEHLHASGIIAVVVAGLQMRSTEDPSRSEDRLTQSSLWGVLETVITGVAFGLIGLEIRQIALDAGQGVDKLFLRGFLIALVLVAVRAGWFVLMKTEVAVSTRHAARAAEARRADTDEGGTGADGTERTPAEPWTGRAPKSWTDVIVMTWGGMRGLATLALALALPTTMADGSPFPARNDILITVISVLFVTLLAAGLTLPWVVHRLDVDDEAEVEEEAERALRMRMRDVAISTMTARYDIPPLLREQMSQWAGHVADDAMDGADLEGRDHGHDRRPQGPDAGPPTSPQMEVVSKAVRAWRRGVLRPAFARRREDFSDAKEATLMACRREVLRERNRPGTDPEVIDRVLGTLDLQLLALQRVREAGGASGAPKLGPPTP